MIILNLCNKKYTFLFSGIVLLVLFSVTTSLNAASNKAGGVKMTQHFPEVLTNAFGVNDKAKEEEKTTTNLTDTHPKNINDDETISKGIKSEYPAVIEKNTIPLTDLVGGRHAPLHWEKDEQQLIELSDEDLKSIADNVHNPNEAGDNNKTADKGNEDSKVIYVEVYLDADGVEVTRPSINGVRLNNSVASDSEKTFTNGNIINNTNETSLNSYTDRESSMVKAGTVGVE